MVEFESDVVLCKLSHFNHFHIHAKHVYIIHFTLGNYYYITRIIIHFSYRSEIGSFSIVSFNSAQFTIFTLYLQTLFAIYVAVLITTCLLKANNFVMY